MLLRSDHLGGQFVPSSCYWKLMSRAEQRNRPQGEDDHLLLRIGAQSGVGTVELHTQSSRTAASGYCIQRSKFQYAN